MTLARYAYFIRLLMHPLAQQPTMDVTTDVTAYVTAQVTMEVDALLASLEGEMSRQAMQDTLGLKHIEHFRKAYLVPSLAAKVIEMTMPDTPRSSKQRYRLTALGLQRRSEIKRRR